MSAPRPHTLPQERADAAERAETAPAPQNGSYALGARVVTPHGAGKVIRVSPKLRACYLVQLDAGGGAWSYRAEELRREEKRTALGPLP